MTREELRAKVIEGLENCTTERKSCVGCPYHGEEPCVWAKWQLLRDALKLLTEETVWEYCPDDENRARWRCKNCGKIVRRDPAGKLYCSICGMRARKEA